MPPSQAGRTGITLHGDWDNIGQRQTDSGSATFERVRVGENELLLDPGLEYALRLPAPADRAAHLRQHVPWHCRRGAFVEAHQYTLKETRPWFKAKVEHANEDPYILGHYGEFWVGLESVRLLTERANALLDQAWRKEHQLHSEERGELAVAIATAKVAATRIGLDLTSRLFEVTGARSTHAALRLDRYWRNLRTQSLHDPVDYKLQEL